MPYVHWIRYSPWLAALVLSFAPAGLRADDDVGADPPTETPKATTAPKASAAPKQFTFSTRRHVTHSIGLLLLPVSKTLDAQLDLKGEGMAVEHVTPGGAADKAGIKPHDILLAVGDKPIKSPGDLEAMISDGKEISLKVLRAGKPLTVALTPAERVRIAKDYNVDISGIEELVQQKLKDAGVEGLRMQLVQPGRFFPPGFRFDNNFPDDLSLTIRKQGKNPAEIDVKKGDQSWTVKEGDLSSLPDDVRPHGEAMLGQGLPIKMNFAMPAMPVPPRAVRAAPKAPVIAVPAQPGVPATPAAPAAQPARGNLEKQLDELRGSLDKTRAEIEELRRGIREQREEKK
jgi:hypothetical protein